MQARALIMAATLGLSSVANAGQLSADLQSAWEFEARTAEGQVWVMPLLAGHVAPEQELGSYFDLPLVGEQLALRRKRAEQVAQVPAQVGVALPGAVNGQLGLSWSGSFVHRAWRHGASSRLTDAITGGRDLDDTLADIARRNGGGATLFSWSYELQSRPLGLDTMPGELVDTSWGPVVVDVDQDTHLVSLLVGVALVASDGEVLIRYADDYRTVVSGMHGTQRAATDIARDMATEIGKVWAVDGQFDGQLATAR